MFILNREQLANAYAIAKVLGAELSLDEFEKKYSQYYEETINELNSRPVARTRFECMPQASGILSWATPNTATMHLTKR